MVTVMVIRNVRRKKAIEAAWKAYNYTYIGIITIMCFGCKHIVNRVSQRDIIVYEIQTHKRFG